MRSGAVAEGGGLSASAASQRGKMGFECMSVVTAAPPVGVQDGSIGLTKHSHALWLVPAAARTEFGLPAPRNQRLVYGPYRILLLRLAVSSLTTVHMGESEQLLPELACHEDQ